MIQGIITDPIGSDGIFSQYYFAMLSRKAIT